MLEGLGMLSKSEYNNASELLGIGEMDNELLGYLSALDPITRHKALSKMSKKGGSSIGSRAEMEKFFGELPEPIKQGLLSGKLRLADTVIYTIKPVNASKTIKMFETQDVKETGLRNISNGRLPKNAAMLVSGIILLQGVSASLGLDDQKSTVFDTIDGVAALSTGEFTLKANKKQIVDTTSNYVFKTNGFTQVTKGYYKLANPRLIQDDIDIEWEIDLGTVTGINPNTILFGGLHGTITIP
jgi:hypothetical protein